MRERWWCARGIVGIVGLIDKLNGVSFACGGEFLARLMTGLVNEILEELFGCQKPVTMKVED